jgi:glutamate dehydrogenase/leucine dehydrogenase
VLSGAGDLLGWPADQVQGKIEGIFDTTLEVLECARQESLPPGEIADRIAWKRIDDARQGGRTTVGLPDRRTV